MNNFSASQLDGMCVCVCVCVCVYVCVCVCNKEIEECIQFVTILLSCYVFRFLAPRHVGY